MTRREEANPGFAVLVASAEGAGRRPPTLEERVTTLFDEYQGAVYRYVRYIGMPPDDADDIVQEVFLRLHQHLKAGRPADNLRGWIFRVAQNLASSERRAARFVSTVGPDSWAELSDSRVDRAQSPEALVINHDRLRRLHSAIVTLSLQQRQCLVLRAEGLRYREIGEVLGVTVSTVAESLRRALTKMTRGLHD
jgi:RNA polymerase sigma-70 factor, ECF subfamily